VKNPTYLTLVGGGAGFSGSSGKRPAHSEQAFFIAL